MITMTGERVTVEVTDLAFDGKAVGSIDGKVIFLKGGLPGETVIAEITRVKARYCQGVVREILKASPERQPPRCSHFGVCGGCTWQDLAYPEQLRFKKKQVVDCLERLGQFESVSVRDVVPCDKLFFYRNKMEFSFHTGDGDDFTLGLHERNSFDDIFDLSACYLQSEQSNAIVSFVRQFVKERGIPVYDIRNHTGFMRFLMIREGKRTNQTMVNIITNYGEIPHEGDFVAGLTRTFPEITTIIQNQNGKKANIAFGEIERVLYGDGWIDEEVLGCRFRIRANSFFQTNPTQAEILFTTAFDLLGDVSGARVLDLYCGTGSIGLLLAKRASHVVGVELVVDAVAAARENAERNGVTNIEFFAGDVKGHLEANVSGEPFDIIVLDPPRAGLHPKAVKRLVAIRPQTILYISCNPATFARDARMLVDGGYSLSEVVPVDMFPHTMHIELTACFRRSQ
jgi:23S rRNA (uracil1939-C5)-methyltransferase